VPAPEAEADVDEDAPVLVAALVPPELAVLGSDVLDIPLVVEVVVGDEEELVDEELLPEVGVEEVLVVAAVVPPPVDEPLALAIPVSTALDVLPVALVVLGGEDVVAFVAVVVGAVVVGVVETDTTGADVPRVIAPKALVLPDGVLMSVTLAVLVLLLVLLVALAVLVAVATALA